MRTEIYYANGRVEVRDDGRDLTSPPSTGAFADRKAALLSRAARLIEALEFAASDADLDQIDIPVGWPV